MNMTITQYKESILDKSILSYEEEKAKDDAKKIIKYISSEERRGDYYHSEKSLGGKVFQRAFRSSPLN